MIEAYSLFRSIVNRAILVSALLTCLYGQEVNEESETKISAPIKQNLTDCSFNQYINTWLILGVFDNDLNNSGLEKDWIGEATISPHANQKIDNKVWRYFDDRIFSRNYDDYQDLYSYFKIKRKESVSGKVAYAHAYIYSESNQSGELRLGVDTKQKTWLNGELLRFEVKDKVWKRGSLIANINLKRGWNRLLVKVANRIEGRFGFYARFSDGLGKTLPGLTYSIGGQADALAITTKGMDDVAAEVMPVAWREWPYVGAHPNQDLSFYTGGNNSSPLWNFITDKDLMMQASDFQLQAEGGNPPYRWALADGELPPGLSISADGSIKGVIADYAELRTYPFIVWVNDVSGKSAKKGLVIAVKERPNRWVEQARLDALIHGPERTPKIEFADALAYLMKQQGYQLGLPISYNNGEKPARFRWPSSFDEKKYNDRDYVGEYKSALERNNIKFGMYIGNLNESNPFTEDQQNPMIEEAIVRYHPKAIWFDWANKENASVDALYSMIRSIDPGVVIILNGHSRGGSNGDWDIICFEGWGAWGADLWSENVWPVPIPWPKKHTPEEWLLLTYEKPNGEKNSRNIPSDWKDYLRIQISLIGEGFIANIDHSPGFDKNTENPIDSAYMQYHQKMADWANPKDIPPLYISYTQVDPGPLINANWGYNVISVSRDTIYLHIMKNPRGKIGMPEDKTMTVGPIEEKVESVVWMNTNKEIGFTQRNTSTEHSLTIDLKEVATDPIDTIIKVKLSSQIPGPRLPMPLSPVPRGNIACFKSARFLSSDGSRELKPAGPTRLARNGIDGNMSSASAGGEFSYIYEVDLQRIYSINKILINFESTNFPTDYEILISSDSSHWSKVSEVHKNDRGGEFAVIFSATEVEFIRVKGIKPDGAHQVGGQMAISELQVFQVVK